MLSERSFVVRAPQRELHCGALTTNQTFHRFPGPVPPILSRRRARERMGGTQRTLGEPNS